MGGDRVGSGPRSGESQRVRVHHPDGTPTAVDFLAYAAGGHGTNVDRADVAAGGREEILTGPGPGAVFGPQARGFAFDGAALAKLNYYAYGTLKFGVDLAGGDLDADGWAEIVTGAGPGAVFGPHVRGWNFDGGPLTAMARINFFAYATLRFGVDVASDSLDPDCPAEILTGAGPSGAFGAQVRGFDYDGGPLTAIGTVNFLAFPTGRMGVQVAAGDIDPDGIAELSAAHGPGPTLDNQIVGFSHRTGAIAAVPGFDVTPFSTLYGGRIGMGPAREERHDLLAGPGADPASDTSLAPFSWSGTALLPAGPPFELFPGLSHGSVASAGDLTP